MINLYFKDITQKQGKVIYRQSAPKRIVLNEAEWTTKLN